jgi:hypothetical protein
MGKQVINLETILTSIQSVFGTMATPLVTADYTQGGKPTINMDMQSTDVESIGVFFGQDQPVSGPREVVHTISFPLRSGGAEDTPGDWAKYLKCSCMKETPATHVYTYSLCQSTADWKDMTIWGYTGAQGASASILRVLCNLLYSAKISLDFNSGYASIEFTGKGNYNTLPAVATQPTITRKSLVTPSLINFTGTVFDDAGIIPITHTIDIANEITVCLDPVNANGSGKGISYFTDSKIKYSTKCYVDTAVALDAHADLTAGTQKTFTMHWGTAPNAFTIQDNAVALKSVKESDQNGIKTYDIESVSVGNGFTLAVDTTVT